MHWLNSKPLSLMQGVIHCLDNFNMKRFHCVKTRPLFCKIMYKILVIQPDGITKLHGSGKPLSPLPQIIRHGVLLALINFRILH